MTTTQPKTTTQTAMTTILPNKTVNIPFGNFSSALGALILFGAIGVGCILLPIFIPATWAYVVGWGIAGLVFFGLFFMPIGMAMDVGDRIPEIEAARKNNDKLKSIEIRHPHFWIIVLLMIFTFWTGLGWLAALIWACSPGKVVIPDAVFSVVFENGDIEKTETTPPLPQPTEPSNSSLEGKLIEISQLVEKGLITKDEAESRRQLILNQ